MSLLGDPSASCAFDKLPNFSSNDPVLPVTVPSESITTTLIASLLPFLSETYEFVCGFGNTDLHLIVIASVPPSPLPVVMSC